MAFVRGKKVDGKTYYQLVKNERVDGKHRQRVLVHMGPHATPEATLEVWGERVAALRAEVDKLSLKGRGSVAPSCIRKLEDQAAALEEKAHLLRSLSSA